MAEDRLQDAALENDPGASAEEKARRLTPELERQAEESEAKEEQELTGSADAPRQAAPGVAEHEQDMARRGFEKEGPPAGG